MQPSIANKTQTAFNNPRSEVRYRRHKIWFIPDTWLRRARQRRQLLALSDHQLQDIGISRADAVGEGDKPFWQA
jgi:uncharacterized protein YjiS (DUF1127 family)